MEEQTDTSQERCTKIVFSKEARSGLLKGIEAAASAVGCTLGPRGKTVLIQKPGAMPLVTKDGVTVSRSIKLKDPIERMGADLVKEAATHTNEVAGDGTTTATVLTHALVAEGHRLVEMGYNPVAVCKGIEEARDVITATLAKASKQVSTSAEIAQVATISANGDKNIGDLIAQAMEAVGKEGIITVEDAKRLTTSLEVAEGMQVDRGYVSPYFVTSQEKMQAVYENCYVLVCDRKLSSLQELVPTLETIIREQRSLLIVAEDIEGEALQGLILNRIKSNLPVVAIRSPGYGQNQVDVLNDICVLSGATLISSSTGTKLEKTSASALGCLKKVVVDSKFTTLVGTGVTKEKLEAHVANLRSQVNDVTIGQETLDKLRMRIARLAAGVAVVKVGGSTEIEMIERKYRVEDALNATRAAVEEGIIPGGGMMLFDISLLGKSASDDNSVVAGFDAVMKACLAPVKKIVSNAGITPDVVIEKLKDFRNNGHQLLGYNCTTGKYVDLIEEGVVDPAKVTRIAIQNACSVAMTFLSLDAVVFDE